MIKSSVMLYPLQINTQALFSLYKEAKKKKFNVHQMFYDPIKFMAKVHIFFPTNMLFYFFYFYYLFFLFRFYVCVSFFFLFALNNCVYHIYYIEYIYIFDDVFTDSTSTR